MELNSIAYTILRTCIVGPKCCVNFSGIRGKYNESACTAYVGRTLENAFTVELKTRCTLGLQRVSLIQ